MPITANTAVANLARLVDRALLIALVMASVIALASSAFAEDPLSFSPSSAEQVVANPDYRVVWCFNMRKTCPLCDTASAISAASASGDAPYCSEWNPDASGIDLLTYNHQHRAQDYRPTSGAAGCASCGGASPGAANGAGLMDATLVRTHSFRSMTQRSSFGPGVYGNYDVSLAIARTSAGAWQVTVNDPNTQAPLVLTDVGGGWFRGNGLGDVVQGLKFYTGSAGSGSVTADPSTAVSAVVTGFNGYRYVFGLIDPQGGLPAPWVHADIGTMSSYGSSGATSSSAMSLSAAGSGIGAGTGGTSDNFGYDFVAVIGDTTITARVASVATYRGLAADGTLWSAQCGVMIREGLDANATAVALAATPGGGVTFQSRLTTGAVMGQDAQVAGTLPTWVRLQRSGTTITGAISDDGTTWTTVASKTVTMHAIVYVGLALSSHQDAYVSDASFDQVAVTGTAVAPASWPVPTTAPYYSGSRAGRLLQILDRNGYGIQLAYTTWTPAQLLVSPDLAWQIATVTDAHGRTLRFSYGSAQVSGRWAVSSVVLPTGVTVAYTYSNGLLASVAYANGDTSSFTYTPNATTGCTVVGYDDAGATGIHRRQSSYLTNVFSAGMGNNNAYQVYNQASNLIRILLTGANEVAYVNAFPQVGAWTTWNYIGRGRMTQVNQAGYVLQIGTLSSWSQSGGVISATALESQPTTTTYANAAAYWQGTLTSATDAQGVAKTFTSDADGFPTVVTYGDGTTEKYSYNAFKQVTRVEDRLHRVTLTTYDTQGNLTKREEGLLFNGTADVAQPEYASSQKQYYPAGDAQQYLLKADIDAAGNTTTYTYTSVSGTANNHFLATVTTPADTGSGTILASTLTYDSAGRLVSSADAVGRTSTSAYDSRDRLVKTTFSDGSTEITVYATGTDKNLVSQRKDRQGMLSDYAYDGAGRLITTTVGAKTMSTDGATITVIPAATVALGSLQVQDVVAYLPGTTLPVTRLRNGALTAWTYDYRQRALTETRYPLPAMALTTTTLYVNNLLRQVTDPYGRKSYRAYRASDARLVRQVQGLIPGDGLADYAAAAAATRSATTNPPYLVTDYTLDAAGQQIAVIDPRGITSTTAFDSRGRITAQVEASSDPAVAGRTETVYDLQSNVLEIRQPRYFISTDARGYQQARTTMTYTRRNLLSSRTEAPGTSELGTQFVAYAADGRQITRTDELLHEWATVWKTCCARLGAQVDPAVPDPASSGHTYRGIRLFDQDYAGDPTHETVVTWTAAALPDCCVTDPPDAQTLTETTAAYDVRHRLVARTVWLQTLGPVDPNHPPIAGLGGISSALGLTTSYRYDDDLTDGNGLSNASDADSVATYVAGLGFGPNAVGSAMVEINPAGERRWTISDSLGRTVRVVDGNGNATTTTYDASEGGLVRTTVTDALGHATVQLVDAAGRVRTARDALGQTTTLGADADGNRLSVRDPNGVGQDCVYDSRNRQTHCTDTAGAVTKTTYDANGNVATTSDGMNQTTTMTYDARNRKVAVMDRLGDVTAFAWDAVGNQLSLTDAQSAVTSYAYDARNLLVTETYPLGQAGVPDVRGYVSDAARRLTSRTDQAGLVTTYPYDFASRLTGRSYSDGGGNDAFTYDPASRLLTAASGRYATTVTRSYVGGSEHAGRLTAESQTVGGVTRAVSYAYDAGNRRTAITYPDGTVAVRTYTARDQLATVGYGAAGSPASVATRTYDNGARLATTTLGNGLVETRGYNTDNTLATLGIPGVTQFSYVYDADKRMTSQGHLFAAEIQTFAYDRESRVTGWTRDGQDGQSWTLTPVGDWQATTRTGTTPFTQTRTHSAVHETTGIAINGGSNLPLTYDAKGNLTSDGTASQTYAWDPENRLKSATVATGTATYTYDALGRRLAKSVAGTTTVFVHDGAQVVSEYENGGLARGYVYGAYVDEPLALVTGGATYFYADNRVYSVAALTDNTGAVVERYRYDTNGRQTVLDPTSTTNRAVSSYGSQVGFTGRYLDQETGLWFFRARYESPTLGRFINRDPAGYIDGSSLYMAYFVPYRVDPWGTDCKVDIVVRINETEDPLPLWTHLTNPAGAKIANIDGDHSSLSDVIKEVKRQAGDCCINSLTLIQHGLAGGLSFGTSRIDAATVMLMDLALHGNDKVSKKYGNEFADLQSLKANFCPNAPVRILQCGVTSGESSVLEEERRLLYTYLSTVWDTRVVGTQGTVSLLNLLPSYFYADPNTVSQINLPPGSIALDQYDVVVHSLKTLFGNDSGSSGNYSH